MVALDRGPLRGVQKHAPFVPGKRKRLLQLFLIRDWSNAPKSVWMLVWVYRSGWCGRRKLSRYRVIQQCFGGFTWQVCRELKESVFARAANILDPIGRNTD